ncbi:MAG: lipid A deacylase LpxR family protein [Gammaproteobacteria bacterium]|nr:lipid A deacylase LpxR family protein [Gammaproteobacteria bacterium]
MVIANPINNEVTNSYAVLFAIFALFVVNFETLAAGVTGSDIQQESPLLLAAFIEDEKRPQQAPLDKKFQEKDTSSWAFYFDNDLFASPGKDRDYTGGVSLTLSGAKAASHAISVDPVLGTLNHWLGIGGVGDTTLHSVEFGLTAFTPDNILSKIPVFDDRPYASLIYISNTRQSVNHQSKSSVISSLTLGVLGFNVAGEFQNTIHKVVNADQARGWDKQISDGGEATFRYSLSKQYVRWADYSDASSNYEIKTARKVSVGYLTDVSWSVSGRFGRIRTPWSSFNPQNTTYAEKALPLADVTTKPKNEFYIWAGLSMHLRAYNVLFQGQFKDSIVTYDSDELNHLVGETWLGVTSELDSGLRLSYFLRGQTSEIKKGPGSRNPIWGGIVISRSI